MKDITRV